MAVQIVPACRALTGKAARIFGRCALVAIGASFGAISVSTFSADLATGSARPIIIPSPLTRADHPPVTVQPSAAPDPKSDHLAAHARTLDRLYGELIRWTPPSCSSGSSEASIEGIC
jgi:hypothetical protein